MFLFHPDNCQNYHSGWIMQGVGDTNYGISDKKGRFAQGLCWLCLLYSIWSMILLTSASVVRSLAWHHVMSSDARLIFWARTSTDTVCDSISFAIAASSL